MNTPRKHHYLPQFYLEGFKIEPQIGKKTHIWQIEKSGDQACYSPAIEDTGCIRDFHTLDFGDKEPDHKSVEALLSKLESEHSVLVREIRDTKRIETSQVEPLSAFISLMRHRVPSFADYAETFLRSEVLDTFKIMYHQGKFPPPPPELQRAFDNDGIDRSLHVKISNWKILAHMFQAGLSPESTGLLAEYNFHVYLAKEPAFFITSDNPVALYHPNYAKIRPYGVGLAMNGVEITFPLTSNILIRAGHNLEPGISTASEAEIDEFNRRTITMSERYIFSCIVNPCLTRGIRDLKDVRAGWVFDNLFYGDGSGAMIESGVWA